MRRAFLWKYTAHFPSNVKSRYLLTYLSSISFQEVQAEARNSLSRHQVSPSVFAQDEKEAPVASSPSPPVIQVWREVADLLCAAGEKQKGEWLKKVLGSSSSAPSFEKAAVKPNAYTTPERDEKSVNEDHDEGGPASTALYLLPLLQQWELNGLLSPAKKPHESFSPFLQKQSVPAPRLSYTRDLCGDFRARPARGGVGAQHDPDALQVIKEDWKKELQRRSFWREKEESFLKQIVIGTLWEAFPRYVAIMLRDETLVAALLEDHARGESRRRVLVWVSRILLEKIADVQERGECSTPLLEQLATEEVCWRALSVWWKIEGQLKRKDRKNGVILQVDDAAGEQQALLEVLVKALRVTGEQQWKLYASTSFSVNAAEERALPLRLVEAIRSSTTAIVSSFAQPLASAAYRVKRAHTTIGSVLPVLLRELYSLAVPVTSKLVQAALQHCSSPLPSSTFHRPFWQNKEKMECSHPPQLIRYSFPSVSAEQLSTSLLSYVNEPVLAAPQDGKEPWERAVAVLEVAHKTKAFIITDLHLRCLLSGLLISKESWKAVLRCTGRVLPLLQTHQHQRFSGEALSPLLSDPTLVVLSMCFKKSSWESAVKVIDMRSLLLESGAISPSQLPSRPLQSSAPSPTLLRRIHLIVSLHGTWQSALQWLKEARRFAEHRQRRRQGGGAAAIDVTHYLYTLYAFAGAGELKQSQQLYLSLYHSDPSEVVCSSTWDTVKTIGVTPNGTVVEETSVAAAGSAENDAEKAPLHHSPSPSPVSLNAVLLIVFAVRCIDRRYFACLSPFGYFLLDTVWSDETPSLPTLLPCETDRSIAKAVVLLGLLFSAEDAELCKVLLTWKVELPMILHGCFMLLTLTGLESVEAPIRLAVNALRNHCSAPRGKMMRSQRYVSTAHQLERSKFLAYELALFACRCEAGSASGSSLPAEVIEALIQSTATVGVGDVFLSTLWK